jgi:hypothetical protein
VLCATECVDDEFKGGWMKKNFYFNVDISVYFLFFDLTVKIILNFYFSHQKTPFKNFNEIAQ